ncbi:zinc-dependent alcohol dehydrogenase [Actinoplanes lobatus]|uniref:Alcohol dehydrogenase n=1 Tax=Actinoplanes lobatus TaxID=113568 RepID=A0A7W7HN30_9ACTN|nr:zinc-dependent alcohol dehydrogenase [Actinoplanes lobatus]MBB4753561.1 propanol-preferring alcohol dehydrogenase [Actinoplanes lobatus]GGN84797.1 zinc-dependent alcohol dehydrogenase [Actinoplanes lobatus]GIE38098.1 zinc-dependent alcohol dehydrogenase [Actinoplanes lobatus]
MRAAVVTSFDKPLEIMEVAVPEPGPGKIRVRLEASGLCHTDIHAARGDWPVKPGLPFTPGHEGVGIVDRAGAGVASPAAGERVAVPWLGYACGTCEYCVTGWETLCEAQVNTGYGIDGGHAEYLVADARYVVRVPDGIAPAEAAPLTCAGVTTYKAVKVGGVTPGDRVAIFGIGGLGHLAQQYAQIFGGETIGVDVTEEKLALSRRLGAAHVINAATTDPVAAIEALGGADVAVVLAADPRVIEQAHASLRRGGRLVLVSLPKDNTITLPVFQTVLKGIRVIGSIVGTRADLAEVFRLHAAGRTQVLFETRTLDEINDSIEDVLAGRVAARLVMLP